MTVYAAGRGVDRSWTPEREVGMKKKTEEADGGEDGKMPSTGRHRGPGIFSGGPLAERAAPGRGDAKCCGR